jgi:WD40 repeat protein
VEPVQLQVVCVTLWSTLEPDVTEIYKIHLKDFNVNNALSNFYESIVESAAKETGISETTLRNWFGRTLITPMGTRSTVFRGEDSTGGIENNVVDYLERRHIVRAEIRAGARWYELTHDRLVDPILQNNKDWYEANLRVFQKQAELWIQQGRSKGLLLSGEDLAQAEEEAKRLSLTSVEKEFLEECRDQQELTQSKLEQEARERHQLQQLQKLTQSKLEQETRERRQLQQLQELTQNKLEQETRERNRLRLFLAIAGFLIVVASLFAVIAYSQSNAARNSANAAATAQVNAENQRKQAESANATAQASEEDALTQKQKAEKEANRVLAGNLAAEADSQKGSNYPLALLLSAKAHTLESTLLTRTTLFDLLQFTPSTRLFGYGGPVTSLAVSPDGEMIASASCREYNSNNQCKYGEIVLTNTVTHQLIRKIDGEYGFVNSLVFGRSGDTLLLAAGGCVPLDDKNKGCTDNKGQITLWNVTNSTEPKLVSEFDPKHTASVQTIAFSHNGFWLASGSLDTKVILWDVRDPAKPAMLGNFIQGHTSYVYSVDFSNDDKILASAGDDLKIFLWDISNPNTVTQIGSSAQQHTATINSIAFSPDGTKFASASNDFTVVLWTWNASTQRLESPQTLSGHDSFVKSIAFNADGSILASTGFDSQVIVWDTSTGSQMGLPFSGHTKAINAIAFSSPQGGSSQFLFSGGNDRIVIQWDLSSRHPLSQPVTTVTEPDGIGMEATSGSNTARVENEQQIILNGQILQNGHTGTVNSLHFGMLQDGRLLLASASDDQTVILWDVSNIIAPIIFLKLEGFDNPLKMAFFDNGQLVTIEKNSNRAIRWDIDPSNWESRVCEDIALIDTQIAEWNRLVPDQTYQETCRSIP